MELLFKHTWVAFIAMTILNAIILNTRSQTYIQKDPGLKSGYQKLFNGLLLYGNIPWVIMAIGDLSGLTNRSSDYFNIRSLNPAVLTFHLSIIVLWILGARWIYFKGGAEFMERHPGLIQARGWEGHSDKVSANKIKLFFALGLAGGTLGLIMMWMTSSSLTLS